jgi:hypothetical protein
VASSKHGLLSRCKGKDIEELEENNNSIEMDVKEFE